MTKTKAMIAGTLHEMNDSAFEQIGYHFNSVLSGRTRSKQELIDQVQRRMRRQLSILRQAS